MLKMSSESLRLLNMPRAGQFISIIQWEGSGRLGSSRLSLKELSIQYFNYGRKYVGGFQTARTGMEMDRIAEYPWVSRIYIKQMNDILKEKVKRLGELYGILGVSQQAEQKEIRMAYKKMALTLHPDKNSSRESIDMFCRLNDAYSILRDQSLKQQYDKHLLNVALNQQKLDAMGEQRRRFASELSRRQAQSTRLQQQYQANSRKRAKFQQDLEAERQQRQKLRSQISSQMQPSQYYQKINSVKVVWDSTLHFNEKLLRLAFGKYGTIKTVVIEKRNEAVMEFMGIEVAEKVVREFRHPRLKVAFLVGEAKRREMLGALGKKPEKVDFTLNSDNLRRLAEMINRNSNTYVSLDGKSTGQSYDSILKQAGII